MTFQPLTDDLDEPVDDDRSQRSDRVSAPRAIPNQAKSESRRSRTNSSGTHNSDHDAMSISVPRNTIDVHMASVSSSPNIQYALRPVEFVSNSVGRVPENALGLRTAEPVTMSPSPLSPEMKEHEERLAQLRDVLQDPMSSPATSLSRKSTLSGGGADRARPIVPGGMTSTRTPSPVSSTSHTYSASSFEKEYVLSSHRHQLLQPPPPPSGAAISCASRAALEHQQRTRASSTASSTATPVSSTLTHATPTREREPTPPMHAIYSPAPPPASSPARSTQSRRQSTDTPSFSKSKASMMGLAPVGSYPSGLTRSIRAMQEPPRVS
ncbi:hypothetical protein C8Q79DRAFT_659391 [Trametes meyenii]|nr:hypothetical protein C8Q79DRAFT_659391 [Trametes meyenii]